MGGPPNSQAVPLPNNLPFRLVSKTIGSGAYASIRKACPLNKPAPIIAVKFINKSHAFRAGRLRPKQLQLEISLHHTVSGHANIVRFLSHGEDNDWVWLCLELAEGGDLFDKIEADEGCSENVAHLYFTQLVNAIAWCHGKGVAHRDVKPENVLLSSEGDLKLADFGLATQFFVPNRMHERKKCGMVCGSPPYIAPEILGVGARNAKRKAIDGNAGQQEAGGKEGYEPDRSDIWSVAIVLFVLLSGNTPWDVPDAKESYEFYDYLMSNGRPKDELWNKIPTEALSLIRGMLKVDPAERFMLPEVRKHPWFTRSNPEMTPDGRVANPINLATQMMESLRIDFDAQIPASQQQQQQRQTTTAMNLDHKPTTNTLEPPWTKFASTQPETPTTFTDTPFDWETAPLRLSTTNTASSSQPIHHHDTHPTTSTHTLASLLTDLDDPTLSQFSQRPISSLSSTQLARKFNDIVPSHSLARFLSAWPLHTFLPLLLAAFHRLNIPVAEPSPATIQSGSGLISFRIKTTDARGQMLHGTVVVEKLCLDAAGSLSRRGGVREEQQQQLLEVLECRFLKAKGDPVGWRRLFKMVAVLCQEALPRPGVGSGRGGGGGGRLESQSQV